jgi:hypothetical protein
MALRRKAPTAETTTPTPEPAPAAVAPTPEPAPAAVAPTPEPAPEPAPAAAPPATRAQAPAPAPVTLRSGSMRLIWEDKRDLFVSSYGELPRLKASNGNVMDNDDRVLGEWIELQVLSFNELFVVGPCDNKAPAELVKYSYDNLTFQDGSPDTVQDYVNDLRVNWPNAASKKYYEVVAVLRAAAKPTPYVGEMVQVQLSPTSVTGFEGYRKQASFKIALGKLDPELADLVRLETKLVTANANTWTKFEAKPTQL